MLEQVDDAITVVSQDIWLVLAQIQLVQVQFQVLAGVLVLLEEAFKVGSYQEVDLQEVLDLLPAISVEDQTTLLGTVKHKP